MAAKKKSAKKAPAGKAKLGAKSAFVRGLPASRPAKEVVAAAKAAGISLTDTYVYKVRSKSKGAKPPSRAKASAQQPEVAVKQPVAKTTTAADFVRGLPAGTTAKAAVAKAKAEGISLSEGYYYTLKSNLGLAGGKKGKSEAPTAKPTSKPNSTSKAKPKAIVFGGLNGLTLSSKNSSEQAVIDATEALGIARIRAILDAVERLQS